MSDKKYHKVEVDKDVCIGCGMCTLSAPDAFELKSGSSVAVSKESAGEVADDLLLQAFQDCPVSAISLYDETGTKVFPAE